MQARGEKPPSRIIDFDALSNPEGSLLLIDATTAPYIHKYQSVKKFLESPYQETRADQRSSISFAESFDGEVSRIIIIATRPTADANIMYQAGASALPVA
jgi:hypothetical protein